MKVDDIVDSILGMKKKKSVIKKSRKVKPNKVENIVVEEHQVQEVPKVDEKKSMVINNELQQQIGLLQQVLETNASPSKEEFIYSPKNAHKIGKYLAIDCEMVGTGVDGSNSVLARVSIVNFHGSTILDEYVKSSEKITDYRSWVSGIYPHHLEKALDFKQVQLKIANLFKDRILVGHALKNDLKVLMLNHPSHMIRDTSKYAPFKKYAKGRHPSLKTLAKELLGLAIQDGKHCSVEDAKVAMLIFKKVKNEWEKNFKNK